MPVRFSTRNFLFALIAAVVIPLLAFSGLILNRHVTAERERLEEQAVEWARHIALIVDGELNGLVALLRGLASSTSLQNGDMRQLHAESVRLTTGRDKVIVLREFGSRQLTNTQRPYGADLPPAVPIPDNDRETLRQGDPVISEVYPSPISGEPRVAVAIGVMTGGQMQVLAVTVPTTQFRDAIPKVPTGWVIGVGDPRSGRFVSRSLRHDEVSGKKGDPNYFAKASGKSGSFRAINLDGVSVLAGYYHGDISRWLFAANVPQAIVEAPLRQSVLALLMMGIVALFLSLFLAWTFGRNFTRAGSELAQRAGALGSGETLPPTSSHIEEFHAIGEALAKSSEKLQERDEQRLQLIAELNHRVKNTLAVVQSVATQTLRHSSSLADARAAFSNRLQALAAAHDVLTRGNWSGAELREIITGVTAPYQTSAQIRFEGPRVSLQPTKAVALAMVFNELATNAAKYGALSSEAGTVAVTWTVEEDSGVPTLKLLWHEHGGPAVTPPERQGFGSRLIQTNNVGSTTLKYLPNGVRCAVEMKLT